MEAVRVQKGARSGQLGFGSPYSAARCIHCSTSGMKLASKYSAQSVKSSKIHGASMTCGAAASTCSQHRSPAELDGALGRSSSECGGVCPRNSASSRSSWSMRSTRQLDRARHRVGQQVMVQPRLHIFLALAATGHHPTARPPRWRLPAHPDHHRIGPHPHARPTTIGLRILAPAPTTTPSDKVGWRCPASRRCRPASRRDTRSPSSPTSAVFQSPHRRRGR